jgi:hypothetical protein
VFPEDPVDGNRTDNSVKRFSWSRNIGVSRDDRCGRETRRSIQNWDS